MPVKPSPEFQCTGCSGVFLRCSVTVNPFDKTQVITGCPLCHEAFGNEQRVLCQVEGCDKAATGGVLTTGGRVSVCTDHAKKTRWNK